MTRAWSEPDRREAFERTHDRLMDFMASGYFPRAAVQTERDRGFYELLVQRFEIEGDYQGVLGNISTIHEHLRFLHERTIDRILTWGGVPVAVASIVIGWFGINMVEVTTTSEGLDWGLTLGMVVGATFCLSALIWLPLRLLNRRASRRR